MKSLSLNNVGSSPELYHKLMASNFPKCTNHLGLHDVDLRFGHKSLIKLTQRIHHNVKHSIKIMGIMFSSQELT